MRIEIVTPAPKGSRTGNRVTAERWRGLLRSLGHRVTIVGPDVDGAALDADLLIAIHARKSAAPLRAYRSRRPEGRLIVALAGTDLSEDLGVSPEEDPGTPMPPSAAERRTEALASLVAADRIVALQPLALLELPPDLRGKGRTILQSALPLRQPPPRARRGLPLVVVGHLRAVKDPLLPAQALRLLPARSRIRIAHFGAALEAECADGARAAMAADPRYRWLGERPRGVVRRAIARAHALLHPSRAGGGANTVGEAIVLGTPVIASAVAGNIGLLDGDYPGLFPAGDPVAFAALLARFEGEPAYRELLGERCRVLAERHRPEREREAWRALLAELD
jgi:putative glycosyltransferase (TIGR04348 family)